MTLSIRRKHNHGFCWSFISASICCHGSATLNVRLTRQTSRSGLFSLLPDASERNKVTHDIFFFLKGRKKAFIHIQNDFRTSCSILFFSHIYSHYSFRTVSHLNDEGKLSSQFKEENNQKKKELVRKSSPYLDLTRTSLMGTNVLIEQYLGFSI